ncbi:MAG TPA: DUF2950 domain-containing protein [Candidatus Sulfotelmatobacter sp.]|nr:DUF2950 domain-containing protein [Candidatus Sulfotelmatobacter sp.]
MKIAKIAAILGIWLTCSVVVCWAAEQKNFATPAEAVHALMAATEAGDQDAMLAIFGDDGKELVDSGDAVQDKAGREAFVKAYKTKHAIVKVDDKTRVLQVGSKGWQLPIPIVLQDGKWHFDTAAGKQELLYRRIGDNELGAIAACRGFIAAQTDYAAVGHDGLPAGIYARRIVSEPGKQNGLYWEAKEGEAESPLGPFMAQASDEGYTSRKDPYHGYYYRILKAQGVAAPGGAKSYLDGDVLKGGVALVAYPAQYRNSGVMTFIINQDGIVYQKDLGENTTDAAKAMTEYNPDSSWKKVTD